MKKKTLRRRCSEGRRECVGIGTVNVDVFWAKNPAWVELSDDHTRMWLCDNCSHELARDV
jgi:hypothetical protein